jgi:hypothetical protein
MHLERDDVAAYCASAAVPDVFRWQDRETVDAAANGAWADALAARLRQLRAAIFRSVED